MAKKAKPVKVDVVVGVVKDTEVIQELLTEPLTDEVVVGDTQVSNTEENVSTDSVGVVESIPKREIRIGGTNINTVVSDIMYAASLGAELVPRILPRISSLPYTVRLLIDEDKYEEYISKVSQPKWDQNTEYNRAVITSPNPLNFVKGLLEAGKRGAVLPNGKQVRVGSPYQAVLAIRNPIAETPSLSVGPKKISYTKEELEQYDIYDLKLIGATLSLTGRGKAGLIKAILDKQKGPEA